MTRVDLDGIVELGQTRQRVKKIAGAFPCRHGEVRPGRVADEQRVAREHDLLVLHDKRAVLRPVARCVHHANAHRPDLQDVAVGQRRERVLRLGEWMNRDGKAVLERKPAVP